MERSRIMRIAVVPAWIGCVVLSCACFGQDTGMLPVQSVIDLRSADCRKILDFAIAGEHVYALCVAEDRSRTILKTTLKGNVVQTIKPVPLRDSSCGITASTSGRVAVWGRAWGDRAQIIVVSAGGSLGEPQPFGDQLYDVRFIDDDNLIAANAVRTFHGTVGDAGAITWEPSGTIDSLYPLVVFPARERGIGVLDFTNGTVMTVATGHSPSPPVRAQVAEAANLPLHGDDGTVVPAFYSADWNGRDSVVALVPPFHPQRGVLLVSLSASGAPAFQTRLAPLAYPQSAPSVRRSGYDTPAEVRLGNNSVHVLSLNEARIVEYALPR